MYSLAIGKYTNKKELRLVVEKNSDMFKASTFSGLRRRVASLVRTTCDQGENYQGGEGVGGIVASIF